MWLRAWFRRLTGKWFGRRLAAHNTPPRPHKLPDVRPELDVLEARYAPAMLAALRQLKELYLDIKSADVVRQELAKLYELNALDMSVLLAQDGGLEELAGLNLPASPQP